MTNYIIEARQSKGNKVQWTIPGLTSYDNRPDTVLWLVGMHHACDTPESVADAIYSTLYDERQTNANVKDGDTFTFAGGRVNKYGSYDASLGTVDVPALRFRVTGVHVVRE